MLRASSTLHHLQTSTAALQGSTTTIPMLQVGNRLGKIRVHCPISKLENRRARSEPGHPREGSASPAAVWLGQSRPTQFSELLLAIPTLLQSTHQSSSNRDSKFIYKCVCMCVHTRTHLSCLISLGQLKLKMPLRPGTLSTNFTASWHCLWQMRYSKSTWLTEAGQCQYKAMKSTGLIFVIWVQIDEKSSLGAS